MNEDNATNKGKIKIIALEWYVPHYTPSPEQQSTLMNPITKKMATELHYPEQSVFTKEVNTQIFWTFELGNQERVNVPIWIYTVFNKVIGNTTKIQTTILLLDFPSYLLNVLSEPKNIKILVYYQTTMMMIIVKHMLKVKKF